MASTTNREGLTWSEWCAAAGIEPRLASFETPESEIRMYRTAWEAGEDPTEWRAALTKRKRKCALCQAPAGHPHEWPCAPVRS